MSVRYRVAAAAAIACLGVAGGCGKLVVIPPPTTLRAYVPALTRVRLAQGEQVTRSVVVCTKPFPDKEDMADALVRSGYQAQVWNMDNSACESVVRFHRGDIYGDIDILPTGGHCTECVEFVVRLQRSRDGEPDPWRTACPWTLWEHILNGFGGPPRSAFDPSPDTQPACPAL